MTVVSGEAAGQGSEKVAGNRKRREEGQQQHRAVLWGRALRASE
jgi:hypothetical protein